VSLEAPIIALAVVLGLLVATNSHFVNQTGFLHHLYVADFKTIPRWVEIGAYSAISLGTLLSIFATILISFIITYVFISWHVRLQYGKYLNDLKQVMNDLGEEA